MPVEEERAMYQACGWLTDDTANNAQLRHDSLKLHWDMCQSKPKVEEKVLPVVERQLCKKAGSNHGVDAGPWYTTMGHRDNNMCYLARSRGA